MTLDRIKPKVLAVIPAKGKSTRIPGKNMKDFNGQPLLYWTVEHARAAHWVTYTVVTSDCEEILGYGQGMGCMAVHRSPLLCRDITPLDPVIVHAVTSCELALGMDFNMVATLQCTSPNRPNDLIDDCIKSLYKSPWAESVVTVHHAGHFGWMLSYDQVGWCQINAHRRPNSQDFEPHDHLYIEDGSVMVTRKQALLEHGSRVVKPVNCFSIDRAWAIDIDEQTDFIMAESLAKSGVQ